MRHLGFLLPRRMAGMWTMAGWDDGSRLEESHEQSEEGRPWLVTEQRLRIGQHLGDAEVGRRL